MQHDYLEILNFSHSFKKDNIYNKKIQVNYALFTQIGMAETWPKSVLSPVRGEKTENLYF